MSFLSGFVRGVSMVEETLDRGIFHAVLDKYKRVSEMLVKLINLKVILLFI